MKRYLSIFCIIFWAGLIGGISFLEAPLKFQAPGITIPLGLGIGQLVFQALNKIELVLLLIILCCLTRSDLKAYKGILLLMVAILLLVDTAWLLPLLDERAKFVLSGHKPTPSHHHILYIILESFKLLALAILGFLRLKSLHHEKRY